MYWRRFVRCLQQLRMKLETGNFWHCNSEPKFTNKGNGLILDACRHLMNLRRRRKS